MTRRVRLSRQPIAQTVSTEVLDLVSSVGSLQDSIAEQTKELKEKMKLLDKLVPEGVTVQSGEYKAQWETPKGRATSKINVSEYRKLVTEPEFIASVSVTKKEASKFVTGAELEKITEVTEAKVSPPALVVKHSIDV